MIEGRNLLEAGAALAARSLPLRAHAAQALGPGGAFPAPSPLAAMRATADRIVDIAVCTRPFRPQGPRIEAERRHGKTLVHHYGHGGSGWSLSWGSARLALPPIAGTPQPPLPGVGWGAAGPATPP